MNKNKLTEDNYCSFFVFPVIQ